MHFLLSHFLEDVLALPASSVRIIKYIMVVINSVFARCAVSHNNRNLIDATKRRAPEVRSDNTTTIIVFRIFFLKRYEMYRVSQQILDSNLAKII